MRNCLLFALVFCFCSCQFKPFEKSKAYNYRELLKHYSAPEDSLKRLAVDFLIQNMDYFIVNSAPSKPLVQDFRKLCSKVEFNQEAYNMIMESAKAGNAYIIINQTEKEYITNEYLINNIDAAFRVWKYPWNSFLSFDKFCETILPYRSLNSVYSLDDRNWIFSQFEDS